MGKTTPKVTADKKEKVGTKGGFIHTHTCCLFGRTLKMKPFPPAVNQSDLQHDWAAGQTVKRKRGRKPKVMMGVNLNRPHHKDDRASEKQEERSDSESSEHGELQYG